MGIVGGGSGSKRRQRGLFIVVTWRGLFGNALPLVKEDQELFAGATYRACRMTAHYVMVWETHTVFVLYDSTCCDEGAMV